MPRLSRNDCWRRELRRTLRRRRGGKVCTVRGGEHPSGHHAEEGSVWCEGYGARASYELAFRLHGGDSGLNENGSHASRLANQMPADGTAWSLSTASETASVASLQRVFESSVQRPNHLPHMENHLPHLDRAACCMCCLPHRFTCC